MSYESLDGELVVQLWESSYYGNFHNFYFFWYKKERNGRCFSDCGFNDFWDTKYSGFLFQ